MALPLIGLLGFLPLIMGIAKLFNLGDDDDDQALRQDTKNKHEDKINESHIHVNNHNIQYEQYIFPYTDICYFFWKA